ncbi:MAG: heme peroxidase family protein [Rhodocyclaceae bacterium]
MLNLTHGGHVLDDEAPDAEQTALKRGDVTLARDARRYGEAKPTETPFGYLLPDIEDDPACHLPADDPAKVVAGLKALGQAMVEAGRPTPEGNSTIPAVYTYWGQFVDHDLTANTDRDSAVSDITKTDLKPIAPREVTLKLRNLRRPALDLDSLYGNGPAFLDRCSSDAGMYDGPRFRIGKNTDAPGIPGVKIPPVEDLDRDLPRIGPLLDAGIIKEDIFTEQQKKDPNFRTRAFIGDARNDENLIVAQLHLAFLKFHNAVVDQIVAHPFRFGLWRGFCHDAIVFERARQITRWHYQWLVVNDWLKTITMSGIVDRILLGGPKHYAPRHHELYMPLEYSVAAFRFGHSMVRGAYDHNRNFGKKGDGPGVVTPIATFDQLFLFTGNGFIRDRDDPTKSIRNPFLGAPTLPFNWIIEWDRFTDKGSADPAHFARKIDTLLVPPLTQMVNEGTGAALQDDAHKPIREMLRFLAQRNLLRGYLLSIPTGQSVAEAMGVAPLTETELRQNNSDDINAALEQGGFLRRTPLWYYVLKEAEVRANGNTLGELGSRIVCETIVGLLANDRSSYFNQRGGWDPTEGVKLDNGDLIVTIGDFLKFAGVAS